MTTPSSTLFKASKRASTSQPGPSRKNSRGNLMSCLTVFKTKTTSSTSPRHKVPSIHVADDPITGKPISVPLSEWYQNNVEVAGVTRTGKTRLLLHITRQLLYLPNT